MQYLLDTNICVFFNSIKRYAKEKVRLRKIGKPIHDEFDLLIGVTAIENKLTLVTDNVKDFERLNGMKIENWFKRKKRRTERFIFLQNQDLILPIEYNHH